MFELIQVIKINTDCSILDGENKGYKSIGLHNPLRFNILKAIRASIVALHAKLGGNLAKRACLCWHESRVYGWRV